MAASPPPFRLPLPRWLLGLATLCVALALGLAVLLVWQALNHQATVVGCGGTADCGALLATRWARWGPVPVAVPAAWLYAVMLGGLLALDPLDTAGAMTWLRRVLGTLAACSFLALGAALWFTLVQGWLLRRLCPLCLATHLCACLGSALILRLEVVSLPTAQRRWCWPLSVATMALAWLIGGQLLWLPHPLSALPVRTPAIAAHAQVRSWALPARTLALVNGKVQLNLADYPVLTGGSAPTRFVAVLFDYTCEACRASHKELPATLTEANAAGWAVVLVPTPLDPAYNPAVYRLKPEHANAGLYARYALAVWQVAPEKFAAFDAWLMDNEGALPPPVEEARRQAETLVGTEMFQQALARPEVEQSLRSASRLYQTLDAGEIPKFVSASNVQAGHFDLRAQLAKERGH